MQVRNADRMRAGDNVIVDLNSEKLTFLRLREHGNLVISGNSCSTEPFLGAPWGASFVFNSQTRSLDRASSNPHDKIESATETKKVRGNMH
jgi:hypothetical protein